MRAIFIRHGQSTGNAGTLCHDLALLELTEQGWQQAREVAASWSETPTLIVTSPYLRTQQTAAPTVARFPNVPVEEWPIQEFTYLEPSRWNGTLSVDRKAAIEEYWSHADPSYCDGPGAESFHHLLSRAQTALDRLAALPETTLAYLFSHGQFIHAVRVLLLYPGATAEEQMQRFWQPDGKPAVQNGERVAIEWSNGLWRNVERMSPKRSVGSLLEFPDPLPAVLPGVALE